MLLGHLVNDSPSGRFPSVTLLWKEGQSEAEVGWRLAKKTAFFFVVYLGVTSQGGLTDGGKIHTYAHTQIYSKLFVCFFCFSRQLTVVERRVCLFVVKDGIQLQSVPCHLQHLEILRDLES